MRARARQGERRGSARTPVLGAPQRRVAGPGRGAGGPAGRCGRPGAQTFPRRLREQQPRGRAGQPCRTGHRGAAPTSPPLGSRRGDTRRRPWNRRGEVAHLEGPASPRALRRAGSPRCLPGGRGLCGAARGRGDLESPLHRALLAKEEGAAQRGARLGPRAGAGRCARPEREAEGQPASGSCGPGGRPTPAGRGSRGGGGCSSAVPPRFPPAPVAVRRLWERSLSLGVRGWGAAGGAAQVSRMQRRVLAARTPARVRRQALGRAQATTAWQHGTLPFWTLGPSLPSWEYLLCGSQCRSWPGVSLGRTFPVNTRCFCGARPAALCAY